MAIDLEEQLRAYGGELDRATDAAGRGFEGHRPSVRRGVARGVLVAAAVAVLLGATGGVFAALRREPHSSSADGGVVMEVQFETLSPLDSLSPPVALVGDEMWVTENHDRIERRDARSGELLGDVPLLESDRTVEAIIPGETSVWMLTSKFDVEFRNSSQAIRVDSATGEKLASVEVPYECWYAELAGCRVGAVSAAGALWTGGTLDSGPVLSRVDEQSMASTSFRLPAAPTEMAYDGERLLVGLEDGRLAIVDPEHPDIVDVLALPLEGDDVTAVAVDPSRPSRAWIAGASGHVVVVDDRSAVRVVGEPDTDPSSSDFWPESIAFANGAVWLVGGDERVVVVDPNATAVDYDADAYFAQQGDGGIAEFGPERTFDDWSFEHVVAFEDRLWLFGDSFNALVRISTGAMPTQSGELVARFSGDYSAQPLAVASGDVWIDTGPVTVDDQVAHRIERRDGLTGELVATIDVPQATVFGLSAYQVASLDTVVVAGGVPDTTVSVIDSATNSVLFTHTLEGVRCSCVPVDGPGGIWLGGNGHDEVLRLNATTGALEARIELPGPAKSIAFIDGEVWVALRDTPKLLVIDRETDEIVTDLGLPDRADPVAMVQARPSGGWLVHADGTSSLVVRPWEGEEQFFSLALRVGTDAFAAFHADTGLWSLASGELVNGGDNDGPAMLELSALGDGIVASDAGTGQLVGVSCTDGLACDVLWFTNGPREVLAVRVD